MSIRKLGIVSAIILVLTGCFHKKIDIKNTKHFSFSYTVGNYMNGSYSYNLELDSNNKYIASYKPDGVSDENKLKKEVSKDDAILLENILKKNNIYLWNGFKKADKNVLDGRSFDLVYSDLDGNYISASGYMKYPRGYQKFKEEVHNYFLSLFKDELEKKI